MAKNIRKVLTCLVLLAGFVLGKEYQRWAHKCPKFEKHAIGYDKIQYGVGVSCCGDTIPIPEHNEFYRYYQQSHIADDKKLIKKSRKQLLK